MDLAFALISNEDILFCSDETAYAYFEIAIFADALNRQLSGNRWWLHKIILSPMDVERNLLILIRVLKVKEDSSLLFCVVGDFPGGTLIGYDLLAEFEQRLTAIYSCASLLSMAGSKQDAFVNLCKEIVSMLLQKHQDHIDSQSVDEEEFTGEAHIHYCGLSWQGLPIFSKIFDDTLICNIPLGNGISQQEMLESVLSAKLATIVMNTVIRAQAYVHSIQIMVDPHSHFYHLINFGNLPNNHSLELYASGQPKHVNSLFTELMSRIQSDPTFTMPFTGDLKPYEEVKNLLSKHLMQLQDSEVN